MKITKADFYNITDTWNGYEVTGTLQILANQSKVIDLQIVKIMETQVFKIADSFKDDVRYSFNYQDKPNVSLYIQCSDDIRAEFSEYCNNAVSTILSTYNS